MAELRSLEPADPRRLGGYLLLSRLGSGGQGTVFLGEGDSGERVAVKLLQAVEDTAARARFIRELAVAKRVSTFCTARVIDADVAGDRPYIVSEFVDGPTLQSLVDAEGPRVGGALERLAISTVTALTAIHQAGVVHRDFKPSNVVLGADGPRVIDFGIAKALDVTSVTASQVIGTPSYMAPEQFKGMVVGPGADVFAWAVTIVYAATGRPAFGADSVPAVIQRILYEDADLAGLTGPLREVVTAALAKDPWERPTAQQVLLRLVGTDAVGSESAGELITEAQALAADTAPLPQMPPRLQAGTPAAQAAGTQPRRSMQTFVLGVLGGLAALLALGLIAAAVVPRLMPSPAPQPRSVGPADTVTKTATLATSTAQSALGGTAIPAAFDGTWSGTATNQAGVTFPLTATFQTGGTSVEVSYAPPATCTTTANLTSSSPQQLTLSIQSSTNCTPGEVTVTLSDTGLAWNFISISHRYSIQAVLIRK